MTGKLNLPWTKSPLIINAPMRGFAGPDLASAVTKAGGLGQIGSGDDVKLLREQLAQVKLDLHSIASSHQDVLPIGVGLLPFILKIDDVLPTLQEFKPAVVWLFAAHEISDYADWSSKIRSSCPTSKVWIQVGSIDAAVKIAETCRPDALVLQGIDAGGHGFEKGASIVSLLPEATDVLKSKGLGHIPLIASGGIVDGRGVTAALALGAVGVVMGTRFLAAKETMVDPRYQEALLAAHDGGQNTVRAKVFDELRGPNIWPVLYDGRGLVTKSYIDHRSGLHIDDIRDLHKEALKQDDGGWGTSNRVTVWAGTGVGLVKKIESASDIVNEVRKGAKEALQDLKAKL